MSNRLSALLLIATAALASPALAQQMTGKQFTEIFNTAVGNQPYAACLMPEQFNQLSPEGQIAACDKAAKLAETSATVTDHSNPAQSGIYRMIEFFALSGESSAMLKIDGVRSRRVCVNVSRQGRIVERTDYSLYNAEVQAQLHSVLDTQSGLYQQCRSEFPGL